MAVSTFFSDDRDGVFYKSVPLPGVPIDLTLSKRSQVADGHLLRGWRRLHRRVCDRCIWQSDACRHLEPDRRSSVQWRCDQRVMVRRAARPTALLALLALGTGSALAAGRPVVVQLFTSLGCSDCPPADALLGQVSERDPDVLALDLHVTYWNNVSWSDPYSLPAADQLQNGYAALRHDSEVYTPEAVVEGGAPFVGSNARAMASAISRARTRIAAEPVVPASIRGGAKGLIITIGAGKDDAKGAVWLFGFDPVRRTSVQGGENAGATLSEVNVVRSISRLGDWRGRMLRLQTSRPAGTRFAVIVQNGDGTILAAASL